MSSMSLNNGPPAKGQREKQRVSGGTSRAVKPTKQTTTNESKGKEQREHVNDKLVNGN